MIFSGLKGKYITSKILLFTIEYLRFVPLNKKICKIQL